MNFGVVAYVSPPHRGNPQVFLQNINAYDAGVPLLLYSDWQPYGLIQCQSPELVNHPRARFRMSNFAFLTGLKLAKERGLTHFLYAEDDCRFKGSGWCSRLFDEFLTYPGAVCGGTPCCYNPSNDGHETLRRLTVFAYEYLLASGTPMTIHGFQPGIYFYPNGAISILDVTLMHECFNHLGYEHDIASAARINSAWDEVIGKFLFARYGNEVFNLFAPSVLSYSGCGNAIYSEEDRINMLEHGAKIAIHQCKSAYSGVA